MGRSGKAIICLDACIIGHALVPKQSSAKAEDVKASKMLVNLIMDGDVNGCSPTIMMSEVKWFAARMYKDEGVLQVEERADEVEDLLPQVLGASFRFIDVDFAIAALATDFRLQYYSKKTPFSYNDGLYLATASITGCDALVTTDTHLLATQEVPVYSPSTFLTKTKSRPKQ